MTSVVNIRKDRFDVYIGRPGKGLAGPFGNPFRVDAKTPLDQVLPSFHRWFLHRVEIDLLYRAMVLALRGKALGCFCAPKGGFEPGAPVRCHGQIIANWIDSEKRDKLADVDWSSVDADFIDAVWELAKKEGLVP